MPETRSHVHEWASLLDEGVSDEALADEALADEALADEALADEALADDARKERRFDPPTSRGGN